MAKTKEQKREILERLEDAFKTAASAVFVHFSKLNVADESAMRRELRGSGVKYFVAKKTLIRRALEQLGHQAADVPMEGEIAVAYGVPGQGDDVTAPARLVHEFGKRFADKLAIVGGLFEGALVGEARMREIATIPSMQTLRGMFAQIANSPRQRFAVVLSKVAQAKSN